MRQSLKPDPEFSFRGIGEEFEVFYGLP